MASKPPARIPSASTTATSGLKRPPFKRFGAKAVGSLLPGLTQKAFEKYGFAAASLITDWAAIVGRDLAAYTSPERLKWPKGADAYADTDADQRGRPGAMLILQVEPARALEVQYKTRQITERINAYFGYRAVSDIRLQQAQVQPRDTRRIVQRRPIDAVSLPSVQDEGLRAALEKLGSGIKAKKRGG